MGYRLFVVLCLTIRKRETIRFLNGKNETHWHVARDAHS